MIRVSAILILLISSIAQGAENGELPNPGPRSDQQATFLFKEATTAQKEGKSELAIEDYQKILRTYPRFSEKFTVYQQLMSLFLTGKKFSDVLALGKQALLQHPPKEFYSTIQLMRIEAQLQLGNLFQTKIIADELIKSKPELKFLSAAFIYKAETLSRLGKHKEAFESLDAAKDDSKHDDTELKVRARACSAKKCGLKEDLLNYFHEKNMCFKESAALSKTYPTKESSQVWCDQFKTLEIELKKSKMDPFTREKIKKEMDDTKALTTTWGCQ